MHEFICLHVGTEAEEETFSKGFQPTAYSSPHVRSKYPPVPTHPNPPPPATAPIPTITIVNKKMATIASRGLRHRKPVNFPTGYGSCTSTDSPRAAGAAAAGELAIRTPSAGFSVISISDLSASAMMVVLSSLTECFKITTRQGTTACFRMTDEGFTRREISSLDDPVSAEFRRVSLFSSHPVSSFHNWRFSNNSGFSEKQSVNHQ